MASRFVPVEGSLTDAINLVADELHAVAGNGAATTNSAASPQTMTAAQMLSGVFVQTTNGAFTLNTDTAANIVAAIPNCQVGSQVFLQVNNTSNASTTVAGGTGVTVTGTAAIATLTSRMLVVKVTNVASPAVTVFM